VLTTVGAVYCWGESDAGQTGQNDTTDDIAPALVPLGANYADYTVIDISAGGDHTCVVLQPTDPLDTTRPVRCWGEGGVGQLGLEDTSDIGDDEVVDNPSFNVQL
jgi:alpha-tubulin suppressor-like RCC1 family protein